MLFVTKDFDVCIGDGQHLLCVPELFLWKLATVHVQSVSQSSGRMLGSLKHVGYHIYKC